jgi:hypothetical protein
VTFIASYNNYPGGYALKALHEAGESYMTTVEYMKLQTLVFYSQTTSLGVGASIY